MRKFNVEGTPLSENWSYKVNLLGYYHSFTDVLEYHYIISSHGKLYDLCCNSDDDVEMKDFNKLSIQDALVSAFYLCKQKELNFITYEDFIKTNFGYKIDEKYYKLFGNHMSSEDFVFFKDALFSKTFQEKSNIIIDFIFGFNLDCEKFEAYNVNKEEFLQTIGGA